VASEHGAAEVSENAGVIELSRAEAEELLDGELVGRIGCHGDGLTYVVPVTYAYVDGAVWVMSTEGRKVTMMRANPQVCFEVDRYDGPGNWRSVVAQGRYEELDGEGLEVARELLIARVSRGASGGGPRPSRPASGRPVVAFRIRLEEITGRAVRPA
jgi:nitroimidazol reductase NimA-like FMN-containing flavoprotein (pyridoxamine 5'-phosphate oxidase superfamily)